MKDYAAMRSSDIAVLVGGYIGLPLIHVSGASNCALYVKDNIWTEFDPCNNPADAWPIIAENKISVTAMAWTPGKKEWWCSFMVGDGFDDEIFDSNPLKAAMIVFLKMKEAKNA